MSPSDRVDTFDQARAAMTEVCRTLSERSCVGLGDGGGSGVPWKATGRSAGRSHPPIAGAPGSATHSWSQIGGSAVKTDYRIAIVQGPSRTDFSACRAHVSGLIHQYRAHFPDLPVLISEGFCELFKFTWCAAQGAESVPESHRRLWANPDPDYGAGCRFAYPALLGRTLVGVVEHFGQYGHRPPTALGVLADG